MRELVYFVATSLDGRIAGPGDDISVFPVAGDHIEMIVREWRDTLPGAALDAMGLEPDGARFDTVLMGWTTYAIGLAQGIASPYPHLRQIVWSRSDRPVPPDVERTSDDPLSVVRELKAQEGSAIWLCGGGTLASALAPEIDRLVLKVNPIVLGAGTPLFDGLASVPPFEHRSTTTFASGVVVSEYEAPGAQPEPAAPVALAS